MFLTEAYSECAAALLGASLILAGLITPIPAAHAEQPIDITYCLSLTSTVVSQNEEMTVTSFDFKGIARSNLPDKAFDNLTFHGVGVGRVVAGKTHNYGYIKFMNPDGDYVVTENLRNLGDADADMEVSAGYRQVERHSRWRKTSVRRPRPADPERHGARLYPDDGEI